VQFSIRFYKKLIPAAAAFLTAAATADKNENKKRGTHADRIRERLFFIGISCYTDTPGVMLDPGSGATVGQGIYIFH